METSLNRVRVTNLGKLYREKQQKGTLTLFFIVVKRSFIQNLFSGCCSCALLVGQNKPSQESHSPHLTTHSPRPLYLQVLRSLLSSEH